MTKEEFYQLGEKYSQGKCTNSEASLYEQILIRFENDRDLWQLEEQDDLGLIRTEMQDVIMKHRKNSALSMYSRSLLKIAASVVIALGIGFYVLKNGEAEDPQISENTVLKKTAQKGEKLTVRLADGSVVKLNGGSTISYNMGFSDSIRQVTLHGEAFFEVEKNPKKPFVIKTGDIRTTVLGTSFNINAYSNEEISVTVATGKVHVEQESVRGIGENINNCVKLEPGFQGRYNGHGGKITKERVDIVHYTNWQQGILSFNQASEKEVIDRLEKWYGVDFSVSGNSEKSWNLNASYDNKSLEFVLNSMSYSVGFQYELDSNNIHIKYIN